MNWVKDTWQSSMTNMVSCQSRTHVHVHVHEAKWLYHNHDLRFSLRKLWRVGTAVGVCSREHGPRPPFLIRSYSWSHAISCSNDYRMSALGHLTPVSSDKRLATGCKIDPNFWAPNMVSLVLCLVNAKLQIQFQCWNKKHNFVLTKPWSWIVKRF